MTTIKISKKRLLEYVKTIMEQEPEAAGAAKSGFTPKAPKTMPLSDGAGPTPDEVVAKLKQLSPGAPNDGAKELEKIGGEEVLKKNYQLLAKQFAGAKANPDRIKMPVVDPEKADPDIGDDGGDLGRRIAKGMLDLKPPYAKFGKKESVQRIASLVVERLKKKGILKEENLEDLFPSDLLGDKERSDQFLKKGQEDGSDTDDSAVTLTKAEIPVGKAKPSQKQVYIDKSLWNILKFTGTEPGGTAFGDANMIAIKAGDEYIILDGHHRWSSAFLSGGPTAKVRVQVLDGLNTDEAIAALRAYGNARGNAQKA